MVPYSYRLMLTLRYEFYSSLSCGKYKPMAFNLYYKKNQKDSQILQSNKFSIIAK